jgi:broad specificity phosphatase PhoE
MAAHVVSRRLLSARSPSASSRRFELVLVRHGLTDWNEDGRLLGRIDVGLNERGRAQAAAAAEALEPWSIAAVYSSPQRRTLETAEPIAARGGLSAIVEEGLDEVWLSEAWQGKTVAELRGDVDLERTLLDPMHRGGSIEPIAEVEKRAVASVHRIREAHSGETVVIVSHGDPLRTILTHYLGIPLEGFRRLAVDNGSISILRFGRRGVRLAHLNWKGSLL